MKYEMVFSFVEYLHMRDVMWSNASYDKHHLVKYEISINYSKQWSLINLCLHQKLLEGHNTNGFTLALQLKSDEIICYFSG